MIRIGYTVMLADSHVRKKSHRIKIKIIAYLMTHTVTVTVRRTRGKNELN